MRLGKEVIDYRRFAVVLPILNVIRRPNLLLEVLWGIGPQAKRQMQAEMRRVSSFFGYARRNPAGGSASPERHIHDMDAFDVAIALAVQRVLAIKRAGRLNCQNATVAGR